MKTVSLCRASIRNLFFKFQKIEEDGAYAIRDGLGDLSPEPNFCDFKF